MSAIGSSRGSRRLHRRTAGSPPGTARRDRCSTSRPPRHRSPRVPRGQLAHSRRQRAVRTPRARSRSTASKSRTRLNRARLRARAGPGPRENVDLPIVDAVTAIGGGHRVERGCLERAATFQQTLDRRPRHPVLQEIVQQYSEPLVETDEVLVVDGRLATIKRVARGTRVVDGPLEISLCAERPAVVTNSHAEQYRGRFRGCKDLSTARSGIRPRFPLAALIFEAGAFARVAGTPASCISDERRRPRATSPRRTR